MPLLPEQPLHTHEEDVAELSLSQTPIPGSHHSLQSGRILELRGNSAAESLCCPPWSELPRPLLLLVLPQPLLVLP